MYEGTMDLGLSLLLSRMAWHTWKRIRRSTYHVDKGLMLKHFKDSIMTLAAVIDFSKVCCSDNT